MSSTTTIYDIAKALNITAATVSRALNNNPKISQKTKDLVIAAARKMNYKQNKLALALKKGKSNNVGVIVPRVDRNFFASVIRGIEERLYSEGYQVIICQSHENENREIENIDALLNAQVDGIFMSVSSETLKKNQAIDRVLDKNVPLIFFDRAKVVSGVVSVTINDYAGGYKATKHLIEQGCKRIAHITGDFSLAIYQQRLKGYKQALLDNGLEYNEEYVIYSKSTVENGEAAAIELLKLEVQPDAIFSASDFAALGVIKVLKSNGVDIPSDICVIGFSNEPFTKFMELPISTVDQSPLEMGRISAEVLLTQIRNATNELVQENVVLEPELLIRESSIKVLTS